MLNSEYKNLLLFLNTLKYAFLKKSIQIFWIWTVHILFYDLYTDRQTEWCVCVPSFFKTEATWFAIELLPMTFIHLKVLVKCLNTSWGHTVSTVGQHLQACVIHSRSVRRKCLFWPYRIQTRSKNTPLPERLSGNTSFLLLSFSKQSSAPCGSECW